MPGFLRGRRGRLGAGAAVLAIVAAIVVVLTSGGPSRHRAAHRPPHAPPSATPQQAAASRVATVLPGSTVTLSPAGGGQTGQALAIAAPTADVAPSSGAVSPRVRAPATPATAAFSAQELAWKAALAAGFAGAANAQITAFSVSVPGHAFSAAQQSDLSGTVRASAGSAEAASLPRIGTVTAAQLMAQLTSNLDTLRGALPAGTLLGSQISVIPVGTRSGDEALQVDLKVRVLAALARYQGDLVAGLGTGLVGSSAATAEGLAITVVDARGRRAGWWSAERAGWGSGLADRSLPLTGGVETTRFRNLTGGPAPTATATGGAQ